MRVKYGFKSSWDFPFQAWDLGYGTGKTPCIEGGPPRFPKPLSSKNPSEPPSFPEVLNRLKMTSSQFNVESCQALFLLVSSVCMPSLPTVLALHAA